MRNPFLVISVALLMCISCTESPRCTVEGRITNPDFFGSKVYLVALDAPVTKNVDSTMAVEGSFSFEVKADSFLVKILRVPAKYPKIIEDLVIIPEQGKIVAVLDSVSRGYGTRLNDKLQEWKMRKRIHDSIQWNIFVRKNEDRISKPAADSLAAYSELINGVFLSDNICMINENLRNGIGLLIYKVYFDALPSSEKNYITEMIGKAYIERDAQLKKRFY
jgi:hypothetical protein